ncbi:hypothetical protein SFC43_28320 [Bacteroides sp. CR5/BHMF/2]|nr:hypothetical protein [Bacteroides sp. CR5/BHMF/2]
MNTKYWKNMALGLLVSLVVSGCYGEEDGYQIPDIYKGSWESPKMELR